MPSAVILTLWRNFTWVSQNTTSIHFLCLFLAIDYCQQFASTLCNSPTNNWSLQLDHLPLVYSELHGRTPGTTTFLIDKVPWTPMFFILALFRTLSDFRCCTTVSLLGLISLTVRELTTHYFWILVPKSARCTRWTILQYFLNLI